MIRNFLNSVIQKKYYVMFFTGIIYISGLLAFFNDAGIISVVILTLCSVFLILKNYVSEKLVLFWFFIFLLAFFNASARVKNADSLYQVAPQEAVLKAQIVSIPTVTGSKVKFFADVSEVSYGDIQKNIKSKTYVSVENYKNSKHRFDIGDTYKIKGKLRQPFKVGNPSQFDYAKYLKNYGAYTLFYAEAADCTKTDSPKSIRWSFLQKINDIRNNIIQVHAKYLKSPNLEVLGGIVFGDDAVSPPDYIKTAFINSGLLHILAASGMNVAIIYGIWFFILSRFRIPFKTTVMSGILIVVLYAFMTGLGPSVIRASVMLIFILIGKLLDRDAHSISLLSFVALLMLIYNPFYINDVGFQLSFIVTFGLLVTAPVVFERLKFMSNWLSGAIFVPVIAQLWVAPIQMFYFNTFSLYSVIANIAIVPAVSIVSFGGFISSILAILPKISQVVCFVFDFVLNPFLNCIVFISQYFASLPHSLITTIKPTITQISLYYLSLISLTLLFKKGQFTKKIIFASLLLPACLLLSFIKLPSHNLEIVTFDVQNADAFLIKTPQNKYFIIDSAKSGYNGAKSSAKWIILEYLKDYGIKDIEGFVITHFDNDHSGGAVDLLKELNIKKVYINSYSDKSKISKEIYSYLKVHKNIQVEIPKNNEIIYLEKDFKINILKSGLGKNQRDAADDNENSLITLISYKNFDELFMADAGVAAFEKIKDYLPKDIEVLKVGHHGAKNVVDKKMLDSIRPQVAVISTGINNYGHPNPIILNLLRAHKVNIFRTDIDNSIKIIAGSKGYSVYIYDYYLNKYIKSGEMTLKPHKS